MGQCPRCYSTAQKGTEIVTSLSIGGPTPLSIITYELYRHLPPSPKSDVASKPGEGRKLLTFYDSRQGAARFAAFLQDVTNQQNYRHIIPTAIHAMQSERDELPDLHDLSTKCVELAWNYGVFHNDPELDEWRGKIGRISRSQRRRLMNKICAEILAEFTTRRAERQSLETLGLVAVEYFEDEDESLETVTPLAVAIGFSPQQTLCLVNYLLDDLRNKKVVKLPEGVDRDHPVFGKHEFSPRLVRGGHVGQHEESWLGRTERKVRRRLIKKMLTAVGQSSTTENVERVLNVIFSWLVDDSELLDGRASDGYQLRNDRLFFSLDTNWCRCDTCLRLSARGDSLPCPHPECNGRMLPYDQKDARNFYIDLFQRAVTPLRVEEHTAQLDSIRGRDYQDKFRDGDINVLSCSTTFEMGIDLGDLQAVAMSNVPPTVANYRQRSGRAGRRTSGTALIMTWASDRPHDQTYFRDPTEIIQGQVRVPYIALDNEFIRKRHLNAILLSAFLRYRHAAGHTELRRVGAFFDQQVVDEPHFAVVGQWIKHHSAEIHNLMSSFAPFVDETGTDEVFTSWVQQFCAGLQAIHIHYQELSQYYIQQIAAAQQGRIPGMTESSESLRSTETFYENLLKRLRNEYLINYFSDRGLLPSYSFPLHSVELMLPPGSDTEHLRLQRDLRQAIREYAPGSEVVADKRIWRSGGIQFYRETPRAQEYQICHNCGHLRISEDPGRPLPETGGQCEICGEPHNNVAKRVRHFLTPDGFRVDRKKSGQPARQFVRLDYGYERSALIPPTAQSEQQFGSSMLYYDYQRDGKLLYVNERRKSTGYRICFDCGTALSEKDKNCKGTRQGQKCPGSRIEVVALGFIQQTNTLHLRFTQSADVIVPSADNRSFWLSVMYALIHGASRALQIERRDINGVLYPRMSADNWEQTIVLYDDVPGGAGYVRQIMQEFPRVVQEALLILNCNDCDPDTSCTHCLRDYNNEMFWDSLKRREALRFLETLHTDLLADNEGMGRVIALNLPHWLLRHVENARHEVWIAARSVDRSMPFGASRGWLDVLADLLQRGIRATLFLNRFEISRHDPLNLSIARYLDFLVARGLRLYWVDRLPAWHVVIDPQDADYFRVIGAINPGEFCLDSETGKAGLVTSIRHVDVMTALSAMADIPGRSVTNAELQPPPSVTVINITPEHKRITEATLFGEVFARPVRTLTVNDPYLIDAERILNRLGAYAELAMQHGQPERVTVLTRRAGQRGMPGSADEQDRCFSRLEKRLGCHIERTFDPRKVEHDRSITIERRDGSTARILIGKGLDFIHADGSVDPTYIVIQDPLPG